jgi:hypothetical protein
MKSAYVNLLVLFSVIIAVPSFASSDPGHFVFAGRAGQFMVDGKKPGSVTTGLPFTIVIEDRGQTITIADADWVLPGAKGHLKLMLSGSSLSPDGNLIGTVIVKNDTGTTLDGLRLDARWPEFNHTGPWAGNQITPLAEPDSPWLLGAVDTGHTTEGVPLSLNGLVFSKGVDKIVVPCILSGDQYIGRWKADQDPTMKEMDFDQQGRIYLTDTTGNRVVRYDSNGTHETVVAKLPGQTNGVAVNPITGDIYSTSSNNRSCIYKFTDAGHDNGRILDTVNLDTFPTQLRFDSKGNLYAAADVNLYSFLGDRVNRKFEQAGNLPLVTTGFDIAPDGSIWLIMENGLNHLAGDGTTDHVVATGQDWHFGQLSSAVRCSADVDGNVYVAEFGHPDDSGYEPPRISEFDKAGNIVRVFGFGSATKRLKKQNSPGQIFGPLDIRVAPNGHVFVAGRDGETSNDLMISEFRPF